MDTSRVTSSILQSLSFMSAVTAAVAVTTLFLILPKFGMPLTLSKVSILSFQGRNVLLTGASSGLGRALALKLAECGAKTLILSGRDVKSLANVAKECQAGAKGHVMIHTVPCDLSDLEAVDRFAEESLKICRDTGIDILINCGGISSRSSFHETSNEVDKLLMTVNFLAGAALAHSIIPSMVAKKSGRLIWISSIQGLVGTPFRTSYAASKFAVQGYCEALRSELASSGVTVHCVSPGYIKTNLSRSAVTGDGHSYGKMDKTTENGADPESVACSILNSVAIGNTDFVVAASLSAKVALVLKYLAPRYLQKHLVRRYLKAVKGQQ